MAENHDAGRGLDDASSGANGVEPGTPESVGDESSGMDELFLSPDDSEGEEIPAVEEDQQQAGAEQSDPVAPPTPPETPTDEQAEKTIRELEKQIEDISAERDDVKNRMMRVAADLENFRKRTSREKEEMRKYGIDKVVLELLPVLDNLERALEHSDKSQDKTTIVDGVRMVHRQFVGALKKHGVAGFESTGELFDPQKHEAIQQVETAEHETGTVLEQYQKGYYLHERLIRPALVVVARQVDGGSEENATEGPSDTPSESASDSTSSETGETPEQGETDQTEENETNDSEPTPDESGSAGEADDSHDDEADVN